MVYVLECEDGQWSVGFVTAWVVHVRTPEIVEKEIGPTATGDVAIGRYGTEIVVNELTSQRVAVDDNCHRNGKEHQQHLLRLPPPAALFLPLLRRRRLDLLLGFH